MCKELKSRSFALGSRARRAVVYVREGQLTALHRLAKIRFNRKSLWNTRLPA